MYKVYWTLWENGDVNPRGFPIIIDRVSDVEGTENFTKVGHLKPKIYNICKTTLYI